MEIVSDVKFCTLVRFRDTLILQHLFEIDSQAFRRVSLLSKAGPRLLCEWTAEYHFHDVYFLPHRSTPFILSINKSTLSYKILMIRHNKILEVKTQHQLNPINSKSSISSFEVDHRKRMLRVLMNSSTIEDKIPKVWIVDMKVKL